MNVRELIALLGECDPDKPVRIYTASTEDHARDIERVADRVTRVEILSE